MQVGGRQRGASRWFCRIGEAWGSVSEEVLLEEEYEVVIEAEEWSGKRLLRNCTIRQHMSAYVSICQYT